MCFDCFSWFYWGLGIARIWFVFLQVGLLFVRFAFNCALDYVRFCFRLFRFNVLDLVPCIWLL